MNSEEFKTIIDGCKVNIESTLNKKLQEYSSKEDKLHNFVEAAKLMRCKTKEYALFGMLNKHLVSVIDMIVKYEQKGILPDENMVEEKIGDTINYMILLKACFLEDIYNNENSCDKESGWTINKLHEHRKTIEKIDKENLCEFCAKNESTCVIKSTVGKTHKIEECEGFIDFKKQEAAKVNSNGNEDIEYLKKTQAAIVNSNNAKTATEVMIERQEQALIANSLWNNARKRLVVEKLRKMLKPIFVWLTDNNKFIDYEKIKGMINRAEFEQDSVADDFVLDVIVAIEQLDFVSAEGYQKRDETITNVIQIMLHPKYKIGDEIWSISSGLDGKDWKLLNVIVDSYFIYPDDKTIGYKSMFGETLHEKYCFKTISEAQRECNNRNNTNAAK